MKISEIENELEDVLLNTFLNHEIFVGNIPLDIKITVAKRIKSEKNSKDKEINVSLNLSSDIFDYEKENREDSIKINQNVNEREELFDEQRQHDIDTIACKPVPYDDADADETKIKVVNLTHEVLKTEAIESIPDKGKKKFTLEQDKEILNIVVALLPGKSLANFELNEDMLKLLSKKLFRSTSSVHQRWKYSLRTWLIQYFSKNHRSWSKNLSVKASVERRKQIVKYFKKLAKKKSLKFEVLNVTQM